MSEEEKHKNQDLSYYKRYITNKIFREEHTRIQALKTKVHFLLYSKHCPIKHYQSNAYHIREAFGQADFESVALIQSLPSTPKVVKVSDQYNPFNSKKGKVIAKNGDNMEYGYSTKFNSTSFPFTLKTLVCSLLTALQFTEDDDEKLTKLKIFKSILYSFSRSIMHEAPANQGKGIVDKKPYVPKPFIAKVEKQFENIIEFEFFNESILKKYLTVKNPALIKEAENTKFHSKATIKSNDPLSNTLGDLKKRMDRVFKINERKYEDNWNQSAEELISFLRRNFGFEHISQIEEEESSEEESSSEEQGQYGMYGGLQDNSSSEEEGEEEEGEEEVNLEEKEGEEETGEDEVEAMFDYPKDDLDWRVDQQVFQPLKEIFGFTDTRDQE